MTKFASVAVVVAAIAAGAYFYMNSQEVEEVSSGVADAVSEAAATVSGAAETAAETAVDTMAETASAVTDAASEAAETAAETASEAAQGAADAASGAVETATESVADMTETANDALGGMASMGASALDAAKALTVENFDPVKIGEMIDGSALGEGTKETLKAAVNLAAENADQIPMVLEQVKVALGL